MHVSRLPCRPPPWSLLPPPLRLQPRRPLLVSRPVARPGPALSSRKHLLLPPGTGTSSGTGAGVGRRQEDQPRLPTDTEDMPTLAGLRPGVMLTCPRPVAHIYTALHYTNALQHIYEPQAHFPCWPHNNNGLLLPLCAGKKRTQKKSLEKKI